MASPLRKRFPRELKDNLGKYLGIFLLMSVTIALTSGFLRLFGGFCGRDSGIGPAQRAKTTIWN